MADLGHQVIAADLDPQSNLTSMFLEDERIDEIWPDGSHPSTLFGAIEPIVNGTGDIRDPHTEEIAPGLSLLPGDVGLSRFEDELSSQWSDCLDRKKRAFRVISAFYRVIKRATDLRRADICMIDVGSNLGAITRAALVASDFVAIPLAPDLYSLQGLRNLAPALLDWRSGWRERLARNPVEDLELPQRNMQPLGYILQQHTVRKVRPVRANDKWIDRIPLEYRNSLRLEEDEKTPSVENDPWCLSRIKNYRSLMPMAMEAQKPMFFLKPADGAIGAHVQAVQRCYDEFQQLAETILERIG